MVCSAAGEKDKCATLKTDNELNAASRQTLLNYERREMTLKVPPQLCFFAHFGVFRSSKHQLRPRPHQANLRGFIELSTKANSYTVKFRCMLARPWAGVRKGKITDFVLTIVRYQFRLRY